MCTELNITGTGTPPPSARLPTIISFGFGYDKPCSATNMIEACVKDVASLQGQKITGVILADYYDSLPHNGKMEFKADGIQKSYDIQIITAGAGRYWSCTTIPDLYYQNFKNLTNLNMYFTS